MAWTKPSAKGSDTSGEHHGAFNLLQADEFINFCADPFNVKNRSALKAKLNFKSMEDEKIEVIFPTWNTNSTMAKNRTRISVPDLWSLNALLLYPPIFSYLYADLHHVTIEEV